MIQSQAKSSIKDREATALNVETWQEYGGFLVESVDPRGDPLMKGTALQYLSACKVKCWKLFNNNPMFSSDKGVATPFKAINNEKKEVEAMSEEDAKKTRREKSKSFGAVEDRLSKMKMLGQCTPDVERQQSSISAYFGAKR